MRGIIVTAGAALLVAVPAAMGLVGNTSFAQSVPVRVPAQATLVDDSGREHPISTPGPRDDKGGQRATSTTGTTGSGSGSGGGSGSGSGTVSDSGSGKAQNGGHGGSTNRTGGGDDGSGHT